MAIPDSVLVTPPHELAKKISEETDDGARWQMALGLGMIARQGADNMQWLMGDVALVVKDIWGLDGMDRYATEIGVKKETLDRYSSVSRAWPPENRVAELSHRHHMMIASREDRFDLILKIADRADMSVEKLALEIKKSEGKLIEDFASVRVLFVKGDLMTVIRWYSLLNDKEPDALSEQDHLVFDRLNQHYFKMKERLQKESQEGEIIP